MEKYGFFDFGFGPRDPAKRSVSKNASQRYQGNVLNRIQSRDFGVFVLYFLDFSTSALGPGTPAKRSVSKNASQRYQGNVLNRIQSRDFKVFVFYRGERLFGILGFAVFLWFFVAKPCFPCEQIFLPLRVTSNSRAMLRPSRSSSDVGRRRLVVGCRRSVDRSSSVGRSSSVNRSVVVVNVPKRTQTH